MGKERAYSLEEQQGEAMFSKWKLRIQRLLLLNDIGSRRHRDLEVGQEKEWRLVRVSECI